VETLWRCCGSSCALAPTTQALPSRETGAVGSRETVGHERPSDEGVASTEPSTLSQHTTVIKNPWTRQAQKPYLVPTLMVDEFLRLPRSHALFKGPLILKRLGTVTPSRDLWKLESRSRGGMSWAHVLGDGPRVLARISQIEPHLTRLPSPTLLQEEAAGRGVGGNERREGSGSRGVVVDWDGRVVVVQRCIPNPLLLDSCRFEMRQMRVFVLVARRDPLLCFYHDGYACVGASAAAVATLHNHKAQTRTQHDDADTLNATLKSPCTHSNNQANTDLIWTFEQVP
jgi:hypothetical protein